MPNSTVRPSPISLLTLSVSALAIMACEKPVPPSYPIADDAASTSVATKQLTIDTDLSAMDSKQVATVSEGPIAVRIAYDGLRAIVQIDGAPKPKAQCPLIGYLSQGGGATRWEHRFDDKSASVLSNGNKWGGSAPRAKSVKNSHRFLVLTKASDFALHIESGYEENGVCRMKALTPTIMGKFMPSGDLSWHRWSAEQGPVAIAVRAEDTKDGPGQDNKRYNPETTVTLVGSGLDLVDSVRFEKTQVTPATKSSGKLTLKAPSDGDTDSIVLVQGERVTTALHLEIKGTIDEIGDAMASLSGAIWSEWLVFLLVGAGIFLTLLNGFPQIRGFFHAIRVVRGKYDKPGETGEINHFQALTTALSATVGLGNIAGVAVAVTNGGPGAVFWMWVCGFLGMATKFSECTLSTAYREVRADGTVAGGPMYAIRNGLGKSWTPLAMLFGVLVAISSFGGGNMFQANQAAAMWNSSFGVPTWVTGIILVFIVGLVIIGGIKRIGRVTDKLVPTMCGLYVIGALVVIFGHIEEVPALFESIIVNAFSVTAAVGGAIGVAFKEVIIQGFRRAAFSNEAGFGSAAIAHAAVKTDEPVREGAVALLEPFIDTIVICTMTALVILISGAWTQQGLDGVALTATAFDSSIDGFGSYFVPVAVFLFAISTMIAWSYYGEKGIEFVFGRRAILPYRVIFVGLVFIGAVWKLGPVLDFSDAMLGLLVVPNMIGVLLLSPKLRGMVKDYFNRMKAVDK